MSQSLQATKLLPNCETTFILDQSKKGLIDYIDISKGKILTLLKTVFSFLSDNSLLKKDSASSFEKYIIDSKFIQTMQKIYYFYSSNFPQNGKIVLHELIKERYAKYLKYYEINENFFLNNKENLYRFYLIQGLILLWLIETNYDSEYYDEFLKENVTGNSALLQFADNGDLPGKVLIKIDRASVDVALNNPGQIYVYYYKEDSDKLVKVAMEIQSNNTFYEFYINHNSKYVLTTEEISEKVVEEDLDMLSLNHQIVVQQQQQIPMIYVIATICGGIAIILLFVVLGKKKQAQQQQTQE
jgi:hypothetical protein